MEITIQNKELMELVAGNMPQESSFKRLSLPRLGMYSQDKTEGKGKAMTVIAEAGTFYIEKQSEEIGADGKKTWVKTEIGKNLQGTIIYYRRQLSLYNEATEKYTNSPVYDDVEEIIPLFCDKKEVAKGTTKELKAQFPDIKDQKVLFVLYEGNLYQMTLKSTSMFAFQEYARNIKPALFVTELSSEPKQKGSTEWNQMTFKAISPLEVAGLTYVLELQTEIKDAVNAEKAYFAELAAQHPQAVTEVDSFSTAVKVEALGF